VRNGNFISRLFKRAPAHPDDVELGSLPQSGAQETTVANAEEKQRRQAKFFFKLTMWALVVVLLIWLALEWEYWARTRRQEAAVEGEDMGSILVDGE
jgi:hypothetical protein